MVFEGSLDEGFHLFDVTEQSDARDQMEKAGKVYVIVRYFVGLFPRVSWHCCLQFCSQFFSFDFLTCFLYGFLSSLNASCFSSLRIVSCFIWRSLYLCAHYLSDYVHPFIPLRVLYGTSWLVAWYTDRQCYDSGLLQPSIYLFCPHFLLVLWFQSFPELICRLFWLCVAYVVRLEFVRFDVCLFRSRFCGGR